MSRPLLITGITLGTLFVSLGAVLWFWLSSPWLAWHLVGEPSSAVAVAPERTVQIHRAAVAVHRLHAVSSLPVSVQSLFPPPIADSEPSLITVAWSQVGEEVQLAALPKPSQLAATKRAWEAQGLVVEQIGPLLRAQRGGTLPRVRAALWQAMRDLVAGTGPIAPLLVADVELLGEPNDHFQVLATSRSSQVRLLAIEASTALATSLPLREPAQQMPVTAVAVPAAAVSQLAPELQATLEEQLRDRLGFTRTRPTIMASMRPEQQVLIAFDGPAAALGVVGGTESFAVGAERWLEDEERSGRPETRAFQLPDGTLGYERVLGERAAVLQTADSAGCRAPLPEKAHLWLCEGQNRVAVGTTREHALALIEPTSMLPWHIVSPSGGVGEHCSTWWCGLKSLTVYGRSDRILIQFE